MSETIIHYPPGEAPRSRKATFPKPVRPPPFEISSTNAPIRSTSQDTYTSPKENSKTRSFAAGVPSRASKKSEIIFSNDKLDYMSETNLSLTKSATKTRELGISSCMGRPGIEHPPPNSDSIRFTTPESTRELYRSENQCDYIPPKSRPVQKYPQQRTVTTRGTTDILVGLNFPSFFSDLFFFLLQEVTQLRKISLDTNAFVLTKTVAIVRLQQQKQIG